VRTYSVTSLHFAPPPVGSIVAFTFSLISYSFLYHQGDFILFFSSFRLSTISDEIKLFFDELIVALSDFFFIVTGISYAA